MDKTKKKTDPLFAVDPLFSPVCNQSCKETCEAATARSLFACHSEDEIKEQTEWSWRISAEPRWEENGV